MPRTFIPRGFTLDSSTSPASVSLSNAQGHHFSLHPVSPTTVRVVHELPRPKYHQKVNGSGINWEVPLETVKVTSASDSGSLVIDLDTVQIKLDYTACPRLQWFAKDGQGTVATAPFLADSITRAYSFDAATGGVIHYIDAENFLPVHEDEFTEPNFVHPERNEYIYGLGESNGPIEKSGRKYTMEGRDALSYDWEHGSPLYKVNPFYLVFNKALNKWYGMYYNSLVDSTFDLSSEHDVLFGCFRSYKANSGPLDYYVILGDGTLPSIVSGYASLVSPRSANPAYPFQASPSLPPLSQFGYLSSSLSLAADPKAQEAIITFIHTSREKRFALDGLYLSSGWCQAPITDDRIYFAWNTLRYPNPAEFGRIVETELEVQTIVNIKPWLLDVHPMLESAEKTGAFMRAAPDSMDASEGGSQRDLVWSSGFGAHAPGRYFDYSSKAGSKWWSTAIQQQLISNGLTGMWIDNNEMAGMIDDEVRFRGELGMYDAKVAGVKIDDSVEKRCGWNGGEIRVGSVGKAINTMGMARATYESVLAARPSHRPVIVSRSGVPGINAYAHATWSGDNSTTWKALKFGTKMTISAGLSFGPGLYGHDVGGFAGKNHPSAELLVRWCQNGAWHSRFTVHSWKEVSTTMWMYEDQPEVTGILRDVLALRYRLAPTFSSLYVTDYHRNGWPLLKPLLWHHSLDPFTLKLDEEFLFGSHVLVASVVEKGATKRTVYIPGKANDGQQNLHWCELDTGIWHEAGQGRFIELDAPLFRTPILVRSGGLLVLGGNCSKNIYDGVNERHVRVFPAPRGTSSGSFILIEDDGKTNDHIDKGLFTELELSFTANENEVVVDYKVVQAKYEVPWSTISWALPKKDARQIVAAEGKEGGKVKVDGEDVFVLKVVL